MGIIILGLTAIGIGMAFYLWKRNESKTVPTRFGKRRPIEQDVTARFISAIAELTKDANLEIASSRQVEVLERKESKQLFGFDMGTNVVQIKVPVVYRYHIRLYDPWELRIHGTTLAVRSPAIQCSLPPANYTEQIEHHSVRGWARLPPTTLLENLRRDVTPTLSAYATDPRRMEFIRETCRSTVAEFVKKWLVAEQLWGDQVSSIAIQFADESVHPTRATLQFDFEQTKMSCR